MKPKDLLRLGAYAPLVIAALALTPASTHAQTYSDLHDFGGTIVNANGTSGPDGAYPDHYWGIQGGGVTFDSAGNMYGASPSGGPNTILLAPTGYGSGMIWELTTASGYTVYKDLHDFGGTVTNADGTVGLDGELPDASITFDSAGNMYGTAWGGGPSPSYRPNSGMVWELTAASGYTVYKDLHDFGGTVIVTNGLPDTDGGLPTSTVTCDKQGNLYGTTSYGGLFKHGAGQGMLWKIDSSGNYTDLHDFGGPIILSNGTSGYDGTYPAAGVAIDSVGDLWGTTTDGGLNGSIAGILWEYTNTGAYKDIHDFESQAVTPEGLSTPDGFYCEDAPTIDGSGNIYGTTYLGGLYGQHTGGTLWELPTGGTFTILHDFGADGDGGDPIASVTIDSAGNLYGTTPINGDQSKGGNVWEYDTTGTYHVLHTFNGTIIDTSGDSVADGYGPTGGVSLDSASNLHGVTNGGGGSNGTGIVWKLSLTAVAPNTPIITPVAGEYITSVHVDITDTTPGASIYYTTDGSTPAVGSGSTKLFAGAFNLIANATVNAIAVSTGAPVSGVASAAYIVRAADPVFSIGSRHISSPIDVTITDATPSASIYYTLNGTAPDPGVAGTFHYHGVPVQVDPGDTLEAIATIVGGHRSGVKSATYPAIPAPAKPTIAPPAGTYVTSVKVNISESTLNTQLYYTTDGSTPAKGSGTTQQYVGQFTLFADATVKAIAVYTGAGGGSSAVSSAAYVVQAADPVFSQPGHAITSAIHITMSDATPNASIYYTLDGSAPNPGAAGTLHYHGVSVQVLPGETVTALATLAGGHRSNTVSATYP